MLPDTIFFQGPANSIFFPRSALHAHVPPSTYFLESIALAYDLHPFFQEIFKVQFCFLTFGCLSKALMSNLDPRRLGLSAPAYFLEVKAGPSFHHSLHRAVQEKMLQHDSRFSA